MIIEIKKYFFNNDEENLKIANLFRPLYFVLTIAGLFPYSVKFQNSRRSLKIISKSIYLNSLCAMSFLLFILAFLAIHVRYVYHSIGDTSMTKEIVTQMNYIVELVNCTAICLASYICAFQNRYIYVRIINRIADMIEPTNRNIDNVLRRFKFEVNVIVVGGLGMILVLQICVNFSRDDSTWKMILVAASFVIPQMIQFITIAFYYVLILMLVVLLMSIRERISNLSKEKNYVMDYFIKAEAKIMTLKHGETVYVKAFELKQYINDAFQAPILVTTLQCFHAIVSESHIIYHGVVVERSLSAHSIINCSLWIIYQFAKIYVLGRTGKLLKSEVLKIGQALHAISTERYDLKLLMEIQHFTTLMSFQDSEITVYGYFSLNSNLLSKVITSAAMYLIIFVQFDNK